MSKDLVTMKEKADFRSQLQRDLIDHAGEFWDDFSRLKPKDKCDIYLKMMSFGFAKAPEEKPLDEEGQKKLILEETTRKATLISGGLPEPIYEDEE